MTHQPTIAGPAAASQPTIATWRTPLRLVRDLCRREGVRGLLFRFVRHLGYRRTHWWARPVAPSYHKPMAEGYHLAIMGPDDLAAYQAFRPGTPERLYRERMERQYIGYAAWCGSHIASVTWVGRQEVPLVLLDRMLTIHDDEWYLFDSYTRPEYRGQRLQGALLSRIRDDAAAADVTYLLCTIEPTNKANIASRTRAGFQRLGLLGRIKIGPWRRDYERGPRRLDK